jgi:hypothetical protein
MVVLFKFAVLLAVMCTLKAGNLEVWGTIVGSIIRKAGSVFVYDVATIKGKVAGPTSRK